MWEATRSVIGSSLISADPVPPKATVNKPKDYTGLHVIEHVVARGETLSVIAANHGLPHWRGIWVFNTRVCPLIAHDDPDKLVPGQRLLVPRSEHGYQQWAAKLGQLAAELEGMEMIQNAELDAIENTSAAHDVAWNFSADVLTSLVSLGVKAAQAGNAALTAKAAAEGGSVANALSHSWASVAGYVDDAEDFTKALHAALQAAASKWRKSGAEKLFDKGAELFLGPVTGKQIALARKLIKAGVDGKSGLSGSAKVVAIAGALADGGRAVMEFADLFKLTTVRNQLVLQFAGETLSTTVAEQRKAVKATVEKQVTAFKKKVVAIEAEKALVWSR